MGLDTQLVKDGTYFMIESGDRVAGCGGWSFRATLYGGDESVVAREPERLDPATDAAKIRAMYTDPDFTDAELAHASYIMRKCSARCWLKRVELMATAPVFRSIETGLQIERGRTICRHRRRQRSAAVDGKTACV